MAEGLFKSMLKERGRDDVEVLSAGVGTMDGMTPTVETVKVMEDVGVDVSGHSSKSLTEELIRKADLILVMEKAHREDIISRAPFAAKKTFLLKKFGKSAYQINAHNADVSDPIGRPLEEYREIFQQIKEELERVINIL